MDRRLHSLVLIWFGIQKLDSHCIERDQSAFQSGVLPIGRHRQPAILLDMFFWRKYKVTGRKLPNRYALRGREVVSPEDCKLEQPMSKTLAQHPLVLLDDELKSLAKEDHVPYKDNRPDSDVKGIRFPMRCWKCDGTLKPEEDVDPKSGMSIQQYACLSCGRRWYGGERPVPATAA
jgi:hypothetical protein